MMSALISYAELEGLLMIKEKSVPWLRLKGKIADEVFMAPKIGFDPTGESHGPLVHDKFIKFFERNALNTPWMDQLALYALVMTAYQLDVSTVIGNVQNLNTRLALIFRAFDLKTMEQWIPNVHIPAYLRREVLPDESQYIRNHFLTLYTTAAKQTSKWLKTLPENDRKRYQRFVLPFVDPSLTEGLTNRKGVFDEQRRKRKSETNAIVPHFSKVRSESHFRFSKVARLRQAYHEAMKEIKSGEYELPFAFFYDEGGDPEKGIPAQERLHFRIWDRRSFVLAHQSDYSSSTVHHALYYLDHYSTPHYLLEFVRAQRLIGDAPPEGFWFEELLRAGLLGTGPFRKDTAEATRKRELLRSWGYGQEGSMNITTFHTDNSGVLNWSVTDARFMDKAQKFAEGVFIPVEPFYVAALFGLFATDLFTTTGARMNEAQQCRLDQGGFVRLEMPAPAGAKDQSTRVRYALRMIPKGERTDKLATYFVGKETERLIEKVAHMLAEHYGLDVGKGEMLPVVEFYACSRRAHRFGPARYLFQYNNKHFSSESIHACMRFLLHGMVFRTSDGKLVIVQSHLLRHAFATHAVYEEGIPVDIVREMLHQKDISVTEYYSQPTEAIVADAADALLARLSAHINVRETLLRSPEELQQQYGEAEKSVGALGEVPGGHCTCGIVCPVQRMCIGCSFKVPDPSKRDQIIEKKRWAEQRLDRCIEEGLVIDAEKLKQTIRDCDTELQEVDMIEAYRKDESRVALIQIEPRRRK
jgi:hypothetical protein